MANKTYEYTDNETGQVFRFDGPDDATPEEIAEVLDQMAGPAAPAARTPAARTPSVSVEIQNSPVPQAAPVDVPSQSTQMGVMSDLERNLQGDTPTPLNDTDLAEYIRMSRDPDVSIEQINQWLSGRNSGFVGIDQAELDRYRDAISRGEPVSDFVGYQSVAREILPAQHINTDPGGGESTFLDALGASVNEGFWDNPMRAPSMWVLDALDADVAGISKEDLRTQFPELNDYEIERLHSSLLGQYAAQQRDAARMGADMRDPNMATRFVGNAVGGISPVDTIPLGRGTSVGARLAESAAENVAADALLQASDVGYGTQDSFNFEQSFMAGATGAALQGAISGAGAAGRAVSDRVRGPQAEPRVLPSINIPQTPARGRERTVQIRETTQSVRDRISAVTEDWQNAPQFEVRDSFRNEQGMSRSEKQNPGYYNAETGTVVINADAIVRMSQRRGVPAEAIVDAVTFHEALGHYGLAQKFRENLDDTLNTFYEQGNAAFRARVDHWLDSHKTSYANDPNRTVRGVEEVLANMSNNGRLPVRFVDRLVNSVKDFARNNLSSFRNLSYSEREVRAIMGMAHDAVVRGNHADVTANGFRWSDDLPSENRGSTSAGFRRPKMDYRAIREDQKMRRAQAADRTQAEIDAAIRAGIDPAEVGLPSSTDRRFADEGDIANDNIAGESRAAPPSGASDREWGQWFANSRDLYLDKALRARRKANISEARREEIASQYEQQARNYEYSARNRDPETYGELTPSERASYYRGLADYYTSLAVKRGKRGDQKGADFNHSMAEDARQKAATYAEAGLSRRFASADDIVGPDGYSPTDRQEVKTAIKTLEDLTEDYYPTNISIEETRGMARSMGLTQGHIKRLKGLEPGEIARKLHQYDTLMQSVSERLAELNDRILVQGDYSVKEEYIETLLRGQHLAAVIFDSQGEIGRALSTIRALQFSRRKVEDFNQVLQGLNGNTVSAFASEDVFRRFAEDMQAHLNSGNRAAADAMQRQVLNPYWWQYVLTFRHAAMLSGLATHAKNFTDSAIMLTRLFEEKALGGAVGAVRSIGNPGRERVTGNELAAHLYGLLQAMFDAETYSRTWKAFKEGHGNHPYSAKIEMQDARIPVVSAVNDALYASDTFFRAFHHNANLYSMGVREAQRQGYVGAEALSEGASIARNADQKMLDEAENATDEALLVDAPSGFSRWVESLKAVRPGMTGGEQAVSFVAHLMFPFLRTTDRLLFQSLRRSPLAFLDKNTREALRKGGAEADIAIARMLMGSALIAKYWYDSYPEDVNNQEEGSVAGKPKNYRKEQALQGGGYRPNSVLKDGEYVDATALNLSWIPWDQQNNIAASVATLHDRWDEGGFNAMAGALLHLMGQQSYAENIGPYAEAFTALGRGETLGQAADDLGVNLASQFVPAAMRQVNQQLVDPIQRNARGDGSFTDKLAGRLMSATPGLSDNLPARHSVYGDEIPHGRSTFGMHNATPVMQDPVSRALQQVERSTRDVVVRAAPTSFQHSNQTVKLTAAQQEQWQTIQGQYIRNEMAPIVSDPRWAEMSVEDKRAVVQDIYEDAREEAKTQMLQELGLE